MQNDKIGLKRFVSKHTITELLDVTFLIKIGPLYNKGFVSEAKHIVQLSAKQAQYTECRVLYGANDDPKVTTEQRLHTKWRAELYWGQHTSDPGTGRCCESLSVNKT